MSIKEEITVMNKTLSLVPLGLWKRFKKRCVDREITLTQGFIEAVNEWLEKD